MKKLFVILILMLSISIANNAQISLKGVTLGSFNQVSKHTAIADIPGVLTTYELSTGETYEVAFMPNQILSKKQTLGFLDWVEDTYWISLYTTDAGYKTDMWYKQVGDVMFKIYITEISRKEYRVFMVITDRGLKVEMLNRKSKSFK